MLFEPNAAGAPMGVRWEESVFAMFEDLEMQAEGLHLEHRSGEVESLADAGYAEVSLASRLQASRDRTVRIGLADGTEIRGRLVSAGAGWLLVDAGSSEWLIRLPAIDLAEGLAPGSLPDDLRPLTARLSVRSVLRRLAYDGEETAVRLGGGRLVRGRLGRVGNDFVEVRTAAAGLVVPIAAIAAVQGLR